MALIGCPECGREVSSSAAVCPVCAYPIATGTPPSPSRAVRTTQPRAWWKAAIPIVARLVVGTMLFGLGFEDESGAGILGGLIVAGSAVPAFYRDRVERLKARRAGPVLDDRIEDRMVEMEHRHREQMADLEERVDFAERLLTRQRDQIGPS